MLSHNGCDDGREQRPKIDVSVNYPAAANTLAGQQPYDT
jgi:hypothetical protein